jgi:NAD(P)-dependent dehydrogenase (short-subunit alcohol dehydrogenase family)
MDDIRREIDVNYFGALHVVRAFAPAMRERGRGAFVNVSSVMAWLGYEHSNSYGASKAANWAMSNGLREELAGAGIQVSSLLLGSTDTDMMKGIDAPKNRPEALVATALDQFEDGVVEILADEAASGSQSRSVGRSGPVREVIRFDGRSGIHPLVELQPW